MSNTTCSGESVVLFKCFVTVAFTHFGQATIHPLSTLNSTWADFWEVYLLSGVLKFLVDVRESYCSGAARRERREARLGCGRREHRADFSLKLQRGRGRASVFVGFGGTSVSGPKEVRVWGKMGNVWEKRQYVV